MLATIARGLRTIRIVQIKNGSLRENICRAMRSRMLRISLDLRRTKFIALHQQRNRSRGERHGGSEELRNPWNQLLRLLYVRNDWQPEELIPGIPKFFATTMPFP